MIEGVSAGVRRGTFFRAVTQERGTRTISNPVFSVGEQSESPGGTALPPFSDLRPYDSWLDHEGRARVSPVECRRNEVFHPSVPHPAAVCPPCRTANETPRVAHTGTDFSSFVWFVSSGDPFQWRPAGTNV